MPNKTKIMLLVAIDMVQFRLQIIIIKNVMPLIIIIFIFFPQKRDVKEMTG